MGGLNRAIEFSMNIYKLYKLIIASALTYAQSKFLPQNIRGCKLTQHNIIQDCQYTLLSRYLVILHHFATRDYRLRLIRKSTYLQVEIKSTRVISNVSYKL